MGLVGEQAGGGVLWGRGALCARHQAVSQAAPYPTPPQPNPLPPNLQDQYLELTTWVHPATHLFGAGERSSEELAIKRNGLPLTVWAHDLGPTFLQQNMYGAHPWVMAVEEGGWVGRHPPQAWDYQCESV